MVPLLLILLADLRVAAPPPGRSVPEMAVGARRDGAAALLDARGRRSVTASDGRQTPTPGGFTSAPAPIHRPSRAASCAPVRYLEAEGAVRSESVRAP